MILMIGAVAVAAALFAARYNGYFKPGSVANQPADAQTQTSFDDIPFFDAVLGTGRQDVVDPNKTWAVTTVEITFRLILAVLLSAALAFRPKRSIRLFQRNLYVSQTQILLAAVAAALMMIVGDNAARAFAIFAAVSLVRFRTNIRDPKEVTVLLICLALGLASGVGRWDLAVVLCVFSLILLWILEYNEPAQAFRSMELTVRTRNIDSTQDLLREILKKYDLEAEVRSLDPPEKEGAIGSIQYYLNLRLDITTDLVSDSLLAADADNVEGVEWRRTKNLTNVYQ
ncbi:MAG: DUF4956 domain-containing protein [Acidobacteria bacterium]|nr:DUF4956 domain-containing protein [Acidobacteriota bacterium]